MFIQLTNHVTGHREEVNTNKISRIIDEKNDAGTTTVVFDNAVQVEYSETPRSIRGYVKKGGNTTPQNTQ